MSELKIILKKEEILLDNGDGTLHFFDRIETIDGSVYYHHPQKKFDKDEVEKLETFYITAKRSSKIENILK